MPYSQPNSNCLKKYIFMWIDFFSTKKLSFPFKQIWTITFTGDKKKTIRLKQPRASALWPILYTSLMEDDLNLIFFSAMKFFSGNSTVFFSQKGGVAFFVKDDCHHGNVKIHLERISHFFGWNIFLLYLSHYEKKPWHFKHHFNVKIAEIIFEWSRLWNKFVFTFNRSVWWF